MNIWIVNYYYKQPSNVRHARHLMFAKYLYEAGYSVTNFSAEEYNGEGNIIKETSKYVEVDYNNYHFIQMKVRKGNNFILRGFSIFQFAWRILRNRKKFPKPDLILQNIHEPFDYPVCWCVKKLKAKYIVDDWDMWAYSFVRQGMIKKNGLLAKFIFHIDRKFFENADRVIFSMEGGMDYIRDMHWDIESGGKIDLNKIHYINNGVDVPITKINEQKYQIDDPDLVDPDTFKAVYMGSISKSNDLMMFIQAARILEQESDYRFLIYGDGNEREKLEKYCKDKTIKNVLFKQKNIPLEYVPYVLTKCNLNVVCHKQGFKYGLSLGKLFQALASGKPICCNTTNNYDIIRKYKLGISCDFVNAQECAQAILKMKHLNKSEYNEMCERVQKTAWLFDYKFLSMQLVDIVNDLLK